MERSQYDFPTVRALFVIALTLLAGGMAVSAQETAPAPAPPMSGEKIADSLIPNVVRIETQAHDHTENGFGFIVGERAGTLYIVTAYHVVSDPQDVAGEFPVKVKLEFADRQGDPVEAKLLGTHDVEHDVAVLTVPAPAGFVWKKNCLGRKEDQERSTAVWFIGKAQKWQPPVAPGHIASSTVINGRISLEALEIRPGSSGGPLIAPSGIVGIILRDSADAADALSIDYIKWHFEQWRDPWDLESAPASPAVATASVSPATAPPVVATVSPAAGTAYPLHEGFYRLSAWNGYRQVNDIVMHLRRVSDDFFLAETTTSMMDYGWSGELRRTVNGWDFKITGLHGSPTPRAGTQLNPASGTNEVSREGTQVTFRSESAIFVWQEQETQRPLGGRRMPAARVEPPPVDRGSQVMSFLGSLATAQISRRTPDQCLSGYVWREARSDDHVCVTEETRRRTSIENSRAAALRNPNNGAYGAETCLEGYVWRDAFAGDHVCVDIESRSRAAADNAQASQHVAHR